MAELKTEPIAIFALVNTSLTIYFSSVGTETSFYVAQINFTLIRGTTSVPDLLS